MLLLSLLLLLLLWRLRLLLLLLELQTLLLHHLFLLLQAEDRSVVTLQVSRLLLHDGRGRGGGCRLTMLLYLCEIRRRGVGLRRHLSVVPAPDR